MVFKALVVATSWNTSHLMVSLKLTPTTVALGRAVGCSCRCAIRRSTRSRSTRSRSTRSTRSGAGVLLCFEHVARTTHAAGAPSWRSSACCLGCLLCLPLGLVGCNLGLALSSANLASFLLLCCPVTVFVQPRGGPTCVASHSGGTSNSGRRACSTGSRACPATCAAACNSGFWWRWRS